MQKKVVFVLIIATMIFMAMSSAMAETVMVKSMKDQDPRPELAKSGYTEVVEDQARVCFPVKPQSTAVPDIAKTSWLPIEKCTGKEPYAGWKVGLKWTAPDQSEWDGGYLLVLIYQEKGKPEEHFNLFYGRDPVTRKFGEKAETAIEKMPEAQKDQPSAMVPSEPALPIPKIAPAAPASTLPSSGALVSTIPPAAPQATVSQPVIAPTAADCNTSIVKLNMSCPDVLNSLIGTKELKDAITFAIDSKKDNLVVFHSADGQRHVIGVEMDAANKLYQFFGASIPGETLTPGCSFTLKEIKVAILRMKIESITAKNNVGIYFFYIVKESSPVLSEVKERKESASGTLTKASFSDTDGVILYVTRNRSVKPYSFYSVPICNITDIRAKEEADRIAILGLYDMADCPPMASKKSEKKVADCDSLEQNCP